MSLISIDPTKTVDVVRADMYNRTQQRLDDFARTRQYDGILSACSYSSSNNPRFSVEGQYCVDVRDATWAAVYQILTDVESGARPALTSFDEIESELPLLVWPN